MRSWARSGEALTPADWVQVVVVAGIGSVLEWCAPVEGRSKGGGGAGGGGGEEGGRGRGGEQWREGTPGHGRSASRGPLAAGAAAPARRVDFFSYSFLDGTLKKAFFPTSETLYWVRHLDAAAARAPPPPTRLRRRRRRRCWVATPTTSVPALAAQVCFGLAMAARPAGALIFGHIGDTAGRARALMLGIILMAGGWAARVGELRGWVGCEGGGLQGWVGGLRGWVGDGNAPELWGNTP